MSWDIFVQDIPEDVKTIKDMQDKYGSYKPKSIGRRSEIIAKIKEVVPSADFSDPSWGIINGPDYSIEVNISEEESCDGFAFHVRGGDAAAFLISDILQHLNLRAFDPSSDDGIFNIGPDSLNSFRKWKEYRAHLLSRDKER